MGELYFNSTVPSTGELDPTEFSSEIQTTTGTSEESIMGKNSILVIMLVVVCSFVLGCLRDPSPLGQVPVPVAGEPSEDGAISRADATEDGSEPTEDVGEASEEGDESPTEEVGDESPAEEEGGESPAGEEGEESPAEEEGAEAGEQEG